MHIVCIERKNLKLFTPAIFKQLEKKGVHAVLNRDDLTIEFSAEDPYIELKAKDAISAIGQGGVRSNIAFRLFLDEYALKMIDLGQILDNPKDVVRVMGRIIGSEGRTKKIMEETTKTNINVFEDKITIIGVFEGVELASDAINALIRGAPHKKVYRLLEAGRRAIKEDEMKLWKDIP